MDPTTIKDIFTFINDLYTWISNNWTLIIAIGIPTIMVLAFIKLVIFK